MPTPTDFPSQVANGGPITVTFAAGATISSVIFCGGASIMGIQTGAVLTDCTFTFETSGTGATGTYGLKRDLMGNPISVAATANSEYNQLGGLFLGNVFVTLVSSVPQVAATTVTIIMRNV